MKITLLITIMLIASISFSQNTKNISEKKSNHKTEIKKEKKDNNKHKKSKKASLKKQRDDIVTFAKTQIGVKYCYGSASPKKGFDCSGFVSYVFSNFGYKVPRSSKNYKYFGKKIALKKCKPGDIILFSGYNKKKNPIGHVGIIISNDKGKIKFIHSASSKKRGVVVSDYNTIKYYTDRFVGIRRIVK